MAHSSVPAPHGLSPAGAPLRRLRTTFAMNSSTRCHVVAKVNNQPNRLPARPAISLPRPQKPSDDPLWALQFLTDREWEVMRCIMDGQTTEQMAETLGVQRSTARTHVQNLLTKLGVHSRLQALVFAARAAEKLGPPLAKMRHAPPTSSTT